MCVIIVHALANQSGVYTGWLKLKYHTGQNALSRQLCEIFIPKCLDLYGRDPATILKLKKYFSFLQSCSMPQNILCHIFNSPRNNQQQLVIFIYVMVLRASVSVGREDCISFQTRPK